jgi:hypothetical protein
MKVRIGKKVTKGLHFIRLIRKIKDEDSWPEVLVLYSDGNLRIKPQAARGGVDPVFGSSVIVGPARRAERPVADISAVTYFPKSDSFNLTYGDGSKATLKLAAVNRRFTRVKVDAQYVATPSVPFATLRSMLVTEDNSDTARVAWTDKGGAKHDDLITSFDDGSRGSSFFFYRKSVSKHNTSAPDVLISDFVIGKVGK